MHQFSVTADVTVLAESNSELFSPKEKWLIVFIYANIPCGNCDVSYCLAFIYGVIYTTLYWDTLI
jgi:hypothetical protein